MGVKGSADSEKISIRSWILAMGWKEWGILLLLGILLLVAGLPVSRKTNKTIQTQSTEKTRLESRLEELGTNTQQEMVYIQDYMGQYNSYLQGANTQIANSNQTLTSLARGQ